MNRSKLTFLVMVLSLAVAGAAFAQGTTTTSVEKKEVEIVQVQGNNVTFIMDGKVMQREVAADFKVNVDGKDVPVSELVPGQKVQLERTTTTRVIPAKSVHTIRNGEVVSVVANTLVYMENGKNKKIVVPKDFKYNVDGKVVGIEGLKKGMKLTATIVTETPGVTTSAKELKAHSTAPAKAEPAPAPEPTPAPAAAPAAEPAPAPVAEEKHEKKLPKTGSSLPLAGLSGGALLLLGAGLSVLRRRLA